MNGFFENAKMIVTILGTIIQAFYVKIIEFFYFMMPAILKQFIKINHFGRKTIFIL